MLHVEAAQTTCRAGAARCDITPPVGIYHRMWGAATHDRSTGVHRPLTATVLALQVASPGDVVGKESPQRQIIVTMDHCLLWGQEMTQLEKYIVEHADVTPGELVITFSHTHGAGLMGLERSSLPGGDLIAPYLDELARRVTAAIQEALGKLEPAAIVYGSGQCSLATHRDLWDEKTQQVVCGFNPGGPADHTVLVGRVTNNAGKCLVTIVNYACHPTTLAWDNTLISPDYVGAMCEVVEAATGAPCLFLQGASGDIGPREGFVGDVSVADRNGRQLGYAALSALEELPRAGTRFEYQGPVISGATIGTWKHLPASEAELRAQLQWRVRNWRLELPYRPDLATVAETEANLARWQKDEEQARAAGDTIKTRDCRAQVERMTRQHLRLKALPQGPNFPLPVSVAQLGGAIWVSVSGEEYNIFQRELRARFPSVPIVVITLAHGWGPSYLCPKEAYGRGIYQEIVAVLSSGCLEALTAAVGEQIEAWVSQ